MELYDNLKLSQIDPKSDYGDLKRLTHAGYEASIQTFVKSAHRVTTLAAIALFRNSSLVCLVGARFDDDPAWNSIMVDHFGLIGVGGFGGWPGYAKVRGVHRGSVLLRWMTNLVLLVANYSPYVGLVAQKVPPLGSPLDAEGQRYQQQDYLGCFEDTWERDLPHLTTAYGSPIDLSVAKCQEACYVLGYHYAGLQNRQECRCGSSFGHYRKLNDTQCRSSCKMAEYQNSSLSQSPVAFEYCGGHMKNAVYKSRRNHYTQLPSISANYQVVQPETPPRDAVYIVGKAGESCDAACAADARACNVQLLPLLHNHCAILQKLTGALKITFVLICARVCRCVAIVSRSFR